MHLQAKSNQGGIETSAIMPGLYVKARGAKSNQGGIETCRGLVVYRSWLSGKIEPRWD